MLSFLTWHLHHGSSHVVSWLQSGRATIHTSILKSSWSILTLKDGRRPIRRSSVRSSHHSAPHPPSAPPRTPPSLTLPPPQRSPPPPLPPAHNPQPNLPHHPRPRPDRRPTLRRRHPLAIPPRPQIPEPRLPSLRLQPRRRLLPLALVQ